MYVQNKDNSCDTHSSDIDGGANCGASVSMNQNVVVNNVVKSGAEVSALMYESSDDEEQGDMVKVSSSSHEMCMFSDLIDTLPSESIDDVVQVVNDICFLVKDEFLENSCRGEGDNFLVGAEEYFDSCASNSMSGIMGRIRTLINDKEDIFVSGFNGSVSKAEKVGLNSDGVKELYLKDMPNDYALLSAGQYNQKGATLLHSSGGMCVEMSTKDVQQFIKAFQHYKVVKDLVLEDGIYKVRNSHVKKPILHKACSGRANKFFNVKVNTSNESDRVLSMLMVGFTLNDLKSLLKNQSLGGMPPDLTEKALNRFEHRHGNRPDIITLAIPLDRRNYSGLMSEPDPLTKVGERVEVDCFESDYNEQKLDKEKKAKKLRSWGGAIASALMVDVYSGYLHVRPLLSLSNSLEYLKAFVNEYKLHKHNIQRLAADSGVVSQSKFQVLVPVAETYLIEQGIKPERAEPNNHSRGTPNVENAIRRIKTLTRVAVTYILTNPAFSNPNLGMTEEDIKRLYAELTHWACTVINLKPCPNKPEQTRYEVFYNKRPNMQDLRLLPIFSFVLLPRKDAASKNFHHQIALYVGPARNVVGAIRAAYKSTSGTMEIVETSKFTAATDGWGLAIHQQVQRSLPTLLETNHPKKSEVVDAEVDDDDLEVVRPSLPREVEQVNDSAVQNVSTTETVQEISEMNEGEIGGESYTADNLPNNDLDSSDFFLAAREEDVPQESDERRERDASIEQGNRELIAKAHVIPKSDAEVQPADSESPRREEIIAEDFPLKKKRKKKKTQEVGGELLNSSSTKLSSGSTINDNNKKSDQKSTTVSQNNGEADEYRKQYKTTSQRRSERLTLNSFLAVSTVVANEEEDTIFLRSTVDQKIYKIHCDNERMLEYMQKEMELKQRIFQELSVDQATEVCFKAVTENVPKDFPSALRHPRWGLPARTELDTLINSGAMIQIPKDLALDMLRNQGADLVILFPVYESKIKEGVQVDKVRLVGDGRTHFSALNTYAATPSREELLMLLHIIAVFDWIYYHVDEIRAFLNSKYKGGDKPVLTKFRGDDTYYQVAGALYGLKTSPRDYQQHVIERLSKLGFRKLQYCSCIFIYKENDDIVLIYDYVDDFVITGSNNELVTRKITELRDVASTTSPIQNAENLLGMELERHHGNKVIYLTMKKKIEEVCAKFSIQNEKKRHTPMPARGYLVNEHECEEKLSQEDKRFLTTKEIKIYLGMVGSLIWITGIRMDCQFACMYLTWASKNPRVHHFKMAKCVLSYLLHSKDLPLVVGGKLNETEDSGKIEEQYDIQVVGSSDASLGTGPKGRSVKAHIFKLNPDAGGVASKCTTSTSVYTSSFEAELDGIASSFKTASRLMNILDEIGIAAYSKIATVTNDNQAVISFVRGECVAKGVRHVELRMYYVREKFNEGNIDIQYEAGATLPVDQLTKIGTAEKFFKFRQEVLGLKLWDQLLLEGEYRIDLVLNEEEL